VIGAIALSFTSELALTADDQTYLVALARLCAQALERARLCDAERSARAEAEAAQRRIAFLAEASAALSASLEYETTLAGLVHLAVPAITDWCIVDLIDAEGAFQRLAVAHSDPKRAALAEELERRYPATPQALAYRMRAAESGRGVLIPEITEELLRGLAVDADHLALVKQLGIRSAMTVPFQTRGRTLGTILLIAAESGRCYGPADLALAEELARRAALAIDNARLYRDAQQALRLRDEFLTSVSHDLRTPLTTIKGMAQLLKRSVASLEAAQAELIGGGLARIDGAAGRMVALVDDLLDLARLQSGRPMTLNRQPTEIVALVRRLASEHQKGTREHRIGVDAVDGEVTGEWDAGRLERVLTNLLSNAIKYSPDGGDIRIALSREPPDGALAAHVRITVADHGIGVPPEDLPRVFERFHRGSNVPALVSGTGIGLAGSRQIVEAHGGTIELQSAEGKGTAVTVRLPLE
jgi:signal transduction histidine kinase